MYVPLLFVQKAEEEKEVWLQPISIIRVCLCVCYSIPQFGSFFLLQHLYGKYSLIGWLAVHISAEACELYAFNCFENFFKDSFSPYRL